MNHNVKAELVILYFLVIILLAGLFGVNILADLRLHDTAVRGAKIGIAASATDGYRTEEVLGACEDVFRADECVSCHEF